jgi:hypothetical protein
MKFFRGRVALSICVPVETRGWKDEADDDGPESDKNTCWTPYLK